MALPQTFRYESRKCVLRNRSLFRIFITLSLLVFVFCAYIILINPALVYDPNNFKKGTWTKQFWNVAQNDTLHPKYGAGSNNPKWTPTTIRFNDTGLMNTMQTKEVRNVMNTRQTQTKEVGNLSSKNALERNVSASDNPRWMPLDKGLLPAFVYAAHYDDVDPTPFVRIHVSISLPLQKCVVNIAVKCLFFEDDIYQPTGLTLSRLHNYKTKADQDHNCKGALAKCPLLSSQQLPKAVALVVSNNTDQSDTTLDNIQVSSVLHVNYGSANDRQRSMGKGGATTSTAAKEEMKKYNITRCFPSLYNFTATSQVLQNVEIGLALGINHFVFYNHSILNPNVNALLRHYQQRGVAEVLDWRLLRGMSVSHNHDQYAAIQDCHHRHLTTSRFIVFADLDEVPLPRNVTNLESFFTDQFAKQPRCGAFKFFNTFFDIQGKASRSLPSVDKLPLTSSRAPQNLQSLTVRGNTSLLREPQYNLARHSDGNNTRETSLSPDTPGFPGGHQDYWNKFAQRYGLMFFVTQNREDYVWTTTKGRKCKQVIIPSRVREMSVHTVYSVRGGRYMRCSFPPEVALLNHYRWRLSKAAHPRQGFTQDLSLITLTPLVMPGIRRTLDRLNWTHATTGLD